MAPNISPPGNRSRQTNSAAAVGHQHEDGKLRIGDAGPVPPSRAISPPVAVSPNSARPAGMPSVSATTRMRLHDRDGAQVGLVFGRQRHHLRERAGARAEQRRLRVPAVHEAQVRGGRRDHAERRNRQHRDAERKRRETLERLRRHHGAERNADQHRDHARQRHRQHAPAGRPAPPPPPPSSEPVTRPAGNPSQLNTMPPTAAIASVSAAAQHIEPSLGSGRRHRRDQCRAGPLPSNAGSPLAASGMTAASAARPGRARSAPGRRRSWRRACP